MAKTITVKTNATLGEISPRNFGRFDADKPLWKNAFAIIENFLIVQSGGLSFSPGTRFVVKTKNANDKIRIERFQYSSSQKYIMEMGNLYMRFCSVVNGVVGQVISAGVPVEVVTPFALADIFDVELANKQDIVYFTHPTYYPQKLIRTSATVFSMGNVPFIRGPFLNRNVTTTTITPSAATGNGITLTASTSIFQPGHVGSLWVVNSTASAGAVVKITGYTSGTVVTGDVQAEPTGAAGNIGGTSAYTDWAEGAFSAVRGFPTALTFFEGRLLYGGTMYEPQKWYASVVGAYDNFDTGAFTNSTTDTSAYAYELDTNIGASIRWMDVDTDLKLGTSGGTITAKSPSTGTTYQNTPQIVIDSDYSTVQRQPSRIGGHLYFLQSNAFQVRQLTFDLITNRDKSDDMTLLADHVLRDGLGGVQIARQQSPNDRLLVPRNDGQLAVFTRNAEQGVQGWCRRIAGVTAMGAGKFESVAVLPQDGSDDLVFVSVQRNVNGTPQRFIEYFTPELFHNDWEPVRLDASLSFNNPITITNITNASPGVITAPAHGFITGDQVKIDNVIGMTDMNFRHYLVTKLTNDTFTLSQLDGVVIDTTLFGKYFSGGEARKMVTTLTGLGHLEGETVSVQVDSGLPASQQTFTVVGGSITLAHPAAVIHVGLPYTGKIQFLPLGGPETQGRSRKVYISLVRLWKSSGGSFGKDEASALPIIYPTQTNLNNPPPMSVLYTGDVEVDFESSFAKDWQPVFLQTKPLPLYLLGCVLTESVEAEK